MSNTEKKDSYTLQEVTYAFLTEKVHDPAFIEVSYTDIKSNNGVTDALATSFKSQCNTFSQYLRKILDILGVKDQFENCKKENNEYSFDTEDKNFLIELIFKYTYKKSADHEYDKNDPDVQIWKAIRNIDNDDYNGFIDIYATKIGHPLIRELDFIRNGFLNFYKKQVGEESWQYICFDMTLEARTQYTRIKWIWEVDNILSSALPLSWEEIDESTGGALIFDHQLQLAHTIKLVRAVIEMENARWEDVKAKSKMHNQEVEQKEDFKKWGDCIEQGLKISLSGGAEGASLEECIQKECLGAKEIKRKKDTLQNQKLRIIKEILGNLSQEDGYNLLEALEQAKMVEEESAAKITNEQLEKITELCFW